MTAALAIGGVLGALVLWQVLACMCWPYVACGACKGAGKKRSWFGGTAFRTCGSCGGSGKKVRTGRRVLDWFRDAKRKAQA